MNRRCFTAGLDFPSIHAALYHDWARTVFVYMTWHRQRSPESARLLLLVTLELLRIHRAMMRRFISQMSGIAPADNNTPAGGNA